MAVPKKHKTSSKSRMHAAAAYKLKRAGRSICSHCKRPVRPHTVCSFCGYYRGRPVLKVKNTSVTRRRKGETKAEPEA